MNTYLISYDLGAPEDLQDYSLLTNYIKSYLKWAKPLQSVWLIKTDKTVAQVRDEIKQIVDKNDKVLVVNVSKKGWATLNIAKKVTDWMKLRM
ncbi:MAG: CRISPR-associated protein Cas2 [Candidatus Zambryskibacteria bacterium]|nr:CRISPR-associated protein Cas2 [Candidatus Zambryskibacteria bacterium]